MFKLKHLVTFLMMLFSLSCLGQHELAFNAVNEYNYNSASDSLQFNRIFLHPVIRLNGQRQSFRQMTNLYETYPKAKADFKIGKFMAPVAIVATAGGAGLGYVALKGKAATAVEKGKTYSYTKRSLPKLIIGLGLFAGGLCLLEYSSELIKTSVEIFNAQKNNQRSTGLMKEAHLGLTSTNNIGVQIKF